MNINQIAVRLFLFYITFIYEGEISYTLLNKWFDNNVVFGTQNNKAVFGTIFCSNPKLI